VQWLWDWRWNWIWDREAPPRCGQEAQQAGHLLPFPFPFYRGHGSWLIIQRFQLTGWLAGGLGLGFGRVWLWLLVWFACHLALVLFFSAL